MTNLAFDPSGNLLSAISLRPIAVDVLEAAFPGSTIVSQDYGAVQLMRKPITLIGGVTTPAPPLTQQEIEQSVKDELVRYAEQASLKHGATRLDSVTDLPVSDPSASPNVIREDTGRSSTRTVNQKRNGDTNGKAKANKAQKVVEDLKEEEAKVIDDIEAGTITTEPEIDARIEAIDLTY